MFNKIFFKPITPHLSIYFPQISSLSSINHRFSGVFLFFFLIYLFFYLILLSNWFYFFNLYPKIKIFFLLKSFFLFLFFLFFVYHFFSGLRLIIWNFGYLINPFKLFLFNFLILIIYFFIIIN